MNQKYDLTNIHLIQSQIQSNLLNSTKFVKGLSQLKSLLDRKNANFYTNNKFDNRFLVRAIHDLKTKGVDIDQLDKTIENVRKQKLKSKEIKKQKEQCYFGAKDLGINNIKQFVNIYLEYRICNNLQKSIGNDFDRLISQKFKKDRECVENATETITSLNANKKQTNNKNRKIYNKIIKQFVQNSNKSPKYLFKNLVLCDSIVMRIIEYQFSGLECRTNFKQAQVQMIKNTIKYLEFEFSKKIQKGADFVLRTQYLNKQSMRKVRLYKDSKNIPLWGIVFLYMRSGQLDKIKTLSRDSQIEPFFKCFKKYLEAGCRLKQKYTVNKQYSDIFLQQINAIMNGRQEISEIITTDRDLIWFSLKTINLNGLNLLNQTTFQQIQRYTRENYLRNPTQDNLQNLILTINYDFVLSNQTVDEDEKVHLILILNQYKIDGLIKKLYSNQSKETIKNYLSQIYKNGLEYSIYYILMINDISLDTYQQLTLLCLNEFLLLNCCVQQFYGKQPSQKTKFQEIIRKAIKDQKEIGNFADQLATAYFVKSKDYIYTAKLYYYIVRDILKSLNYLVQLWINQISNNIEKKRKQSWLLINKIKKQKKMPQAYNNIFQFLQYYVQIKELTNRKQNVKLSEKLFSSIFMPNRIMNNETQQVLSILSKIKSLKIYFIFLKALIYALNLHYSQTKQKSNYFTILQSFQQYMKRLKNNTNISNNWASIKDIISEIHQDIDQKIIQLG